jgi:shikimate kinase
MIRYTLQLHFVGHAMLSDDSSPPVPPSKWKTLSAAVAAFVSIVAAIAALLLNSQRIVEFSEAVLPFQLSRLIPGSAAARFDDGAYETLSNQYVTDARLEFFLVRRSQNSQSTILIHINTRRALECSTSSEKTIRRTPLLS